MSLQDGEAQVRRKAVTSVERDLMLHALGLEYNQVASRNNFAAEPNSPTDKIWMGLEVEGFAQVMMEPNDIFPLRHYRVTDAGREMVTEWVSLETIDVTAFNEPVRVQLSSWTMMHGRLVLSHSRRLGYAIIQARMKDGTWGWEGEYERRIVEVQRPRRVS